MPKVRIDHIRKQIIVRNPTEKCGVCIQYCNAFGDRRTVTDSKGRLIEFDPDTATEFVRYLVSQGAKAVHLHSYADLYRQFEVQSRE